MKLVTDLLLSWLPQFLAKMFLASLLWASSSLSQLVAHFQKAYEREIWCLCTLTFGQKVPKLNSRKYLLLATLRYIKPKKVFTRTWGSQSRSWLHRWSKLLDLKNCKTKLTFLNTTYYLAVQPLLIKKWIAVPVYRRE